MTQSEKVAVQIATLREVQDMFRRFGGCDCEYCPESDPPADQIEDRLRLLRMEAKRLAKTKDNP